MRRLSISEVPNEYLEPTKLDMVTWLPGEYYDPALMTFGSLGMFALLTRRAQESAKRAVSWRGFKVGAAALAVNLEDKRMGTVVGMNIKPAEDSQTNIHAEQVAVAKARAFGLSRILALNVWGEPQADSTSGIISPTLHPCGLCRTFLCRPEAPEITDQTFIMSGNGDFSYCEIYTPSELAAYHAAPAEQRQPLLALSLSDETLHDPEADNRLTFQYMRKWAEVYPDAHPAPLLNQWFAEGASELPRLYIA